jgi:hypothetical protein
VLGFTPTLGQSRVATEGVVEKKKVTGAIATITFFYVVLERRRRW